MDTAHIEMVARQYGPVCDEQDLKAIEISSHKCGIHTSYEISYAEETLSSLEIQLRCRSNSKALYLDLQSNLAFGLFLEGTVEEQASHNLGSKCCLRETRQTCIDLLGIPVHCYTN